MVMCYAENGGSIGAGYGEIDSLEAFDPFEILEGITESYYENYSEFETAITHAAKESSAIIRKNGIESKDEIELVARKMLQEALGELSVVYTMDDHEEELDLGIDVISYVYDILTAEVLNELDV